MIFFLFLPLPGWPPRGRTHTRQAPRTCALHVGGAVVVACWSPRPGGHRCAYREYQVYFSPLALHAEHRVPPLVALIVHEATNCAHEGQQFPYRNRSERGTHSRKKNSNVRTFPFRPFTGATRKILSDHPNLYFKIVRPHAEPLVLCACVILRKKAGWSRKVESLRPCVIATVLILHL